jgi:hypothetical protein
MYDIQARHIPARTLAVLRRRVTMADHLQAGREFILRFRGLPALRLPGVTGAPFCIYGDAPGDDGGGPAEWCWPVPGNQVATIASMFPDVGIRAEPAHEEVFVRIGPAAFDAAQAAYAVDALRSWARAHGREPAGPPRVILIRNPDPAATRPDCDLAIPLR